MYYWDSAEKERNFVQLGQCTKRNVGHLGQFRKKEMLYIWDSLEKESNVVLLGQCRKRKKCCMYYWDNVEKRKKFGTFGTV